MILCYIKIQYSHSHWQRNGKGMPTCTTLTFDPMTAKPNQRSTTTHITPVLNQLHWLPVRQRDIYKIAVLTHTSLVTGQPEHLSVLLSNYPPSRQLRSSDRQLLSQPADNTVFTSRAFSSTAPRIWNSLPITVRSAPSSDTFRRHLKTHLFSNDTIID